MKRLFVITLVLFLLVPILAPAPALAQIGTTTYVATPSFAVLTKDASKGFPISPVAFSTTSIVTANASTTSVAVIPLPGRKKIQFRLNAVGNLHVSIGTTTAVVNGANTVMISRVAVASQVLDLASAQETFEYDANVPMGYIASTAFSITVLQEGRRQGQP